jgi:hypothetical protein
MLSKPALFLLIPQHNNAPGLEIETRGRFGGRLDNLSKHIIGDILLGIKKIHCPPLVHQLFEIHVNSFCLWHCVPVWGKDHQWTK